MKKKTTERQWMLEGVWVSSRCRNKIPQTGWLRQQMFLSHSSRGWEVQDQGASKADFNLRPLLTACSWVPITLCSLGLFFVGSQRQKESKLSGVSSSKGANPIMRAPPLPYLNILLCNHYNGYEYLALAIDFIFFISFNSHTIPRGWYFCPHFRNEKKKKSFQVPKTIQPPRWPQAWNWGCWPRS